MGQPLTRTSNSRWIRVLETLFEPQVRAWRGETPLVLTFWGHGVFVSVVMSLVYLHAHYRENLLLEQLMLTLFLLYTPWVLVAVWRCAETARYPWGLIARLLTIAWAGNTLLVIGSLQLELLMRGGLLGG